MTIPTPVLVEVWSTIRIAALTRVLAEPGLTLDDRAKLCYQRKLARHAVRHAREVNARATIA